MACIGVMTPDTPGDEISATASFVIEIVMPEIRWISATTAPSDPAGISKRSERSSPGRQASVSDAFPQEPRCAAMETSI
jgi:hypothetical protein